MIWWKNYIDRDYCVRGIAFVFKGYRAQLHFHDADEKYEFVYGTGLLHIGGVNRVVESPKTIVIAANTVHAMTPVSDFVILKYSFPRGPRSEIHYTYLPSYLQSKL